MHVILRCVARFATKETIVSDCFEPMKLFVVVSGLLLYAEVGFI